MEENFENLTGDQEIAETTEEVNGAEETEAIGGAEITEEVKPASPKKNKAALIAAILGLVSGVLFIAFAILFFAGITNFDQNSVPEEDSLGTALAMIFVIILFMIPITAGGIIAGLFELGRSVVFFTQVGGKRASRLGVLIAFIIIKLLYCVVVGYSAMIYASFGKYLNPLFLYPGTIAGIVAIICSIAGIPFGFNARKHCKE